MDNSQHVTKIGQRLRRICVFLIFFLITEKVLFWAFWNQIQAPLDFMNMPPSGGTPDYLPVNWRIVAFIVESLPLTAAVYGLLVLRKLFRYYENGHIFTGKTVACFRKLGKTLLVWVIADIIRHSLLVPIFAMHSVGKKVFAIMMVPSDLMGISAGIFVIVIAWVMEEARKIKDDNELII